MCSNKLWRYSTKTCWSFRNIIHEVFQDRFYLLFFLPLVVGRSISSFQICIQDKMFFILKQFPCPYAWALKSLRFLHGRFMESVSCEEIPTSLSFPGASTNGQLTSKTPSPILHRAILKIKIPSRKKFFSWSDCGMFYYAFNLFLHIQGLMFSASKFNQY